MTTFSTARAVLARAVAHRVSPAAVVEVGRANQWLWREACGRLTFQPGARPATDDSVFDLASLTKVLATSLLVLRHVERGSLGLDDRVSDHISSWDASDRAHVTMRDLLSHCSGLPAHAALFQTLRGGPAFETAICRTPLAYRPRSAAVYSDLGFILLGRVLERHGGIAGQFDALRHQMGPIHDIQFTPPELWAPRTAPTQQNAARGRLLTGEVDDDNAWALGGVAGHAGLFGTAEAVGGFARHLLQVLDGRRGAFRRQTLETFITRRDEIPGSSRALGWDTMLPTSSCGARMSARAFGHTGFTGTSLWIDPARDLYVVLLTNRVHPIARGDAIAQVRRDLHDAIVEDLGGPSLLAE